MARPARRTTRHGEYTQVESLHNHKVERAHALERLVVQSGEGLCPGTPCRSIGEGLCPVNALTIQIRCGLMPWNALSFKRVKWDVSLAAEAQLVVVCVKCPVNFGNVDLELDLVCLPLNINCLTKSVTFSKPVEELDRKFLTVEQVKKSLDGKACVFMMFASLEEINCVLSCLSVSFG
ncbi:hypothetical protein MTR_0028s0230 [Medicago truncatula]|uniref:Uncharacterized protein n=1 Tax=Medicago truncatula TaxID=3880 RepID=A0A072TJ89_MEDTR|nr:hypothetical protein MTR_0028s0230 [Medicago truncatula]